MRLEAIDLVMERVKRRHEYHHRRLWCRSGESVSHCPRAELLGPIWPRVRCPRWTRAVPLPISAILPLPSVRIWQDSSPPTTAESAIGGPQVLADLTGSWWSTPPLKDRPGSFFKLPASLSIIAPFTGDNSATVSPPGDPLLSLHHSLALNPLRSPNSCP